VNPVPYVAYAAAYLLFFWLGPESDIFDAWRTTWPPAAATATPYARIAAFDPGTARTLENVLFSALEAALASLIATMYLVGVRSNEVYRLRATPVLIGVAGDSASGKQTFARLVGAVFGEPRVTVISGDDYHRWPRGHEMYKVYTHLHAGASDLHRQREHALALATGKAVMKGTYDHATGTFTEERPVEPGECVVFTGLHALALGEQRALYDLRVFLDPDDRLRRAWKVRRDCRERAYDVEAVLAALDHREKDRVAHVLPQRDHADLVVRWEPSVDVDPARFDKDPELSLRLHALNGFDFGALADALRRLGAMDVEHEPFVDTRWQSLRLHGTIAPERLARIAEEIVPNLHELAPAPRFAPDLAGCLQLAFLVALSSRLRWGHERGRAAEA
jgi:uridine kinase